MKKLVIDIQSPTGDKLTVSAKAFEITFKHKGYAAAGEPYESDAEAGERSDRRPDEIGGTFAPETKDVSAKRIAEQLGIAAATDETAPALPNAKNKVATEATAAAAKPKRPAKKAKTPNRSRERSQTAKGALEADEIINQSATAKAIDKANESNLDNSTTNDGGAAGGNIADNSTVGGDA